MYTAYELGKRGGELSRPGRKHRDGLTILLVRLGGYREDALAAEKEAGCDLATPRRHRLAFETTKIPHVGARSNSNKRSNARLASTVVADKREFWKSMNPSILHRRISTPRSENNPA